MDRKQKTPKSEYLHGGDIYRNDVRLDYSVNLNPKRTPDSVYMACMKGLSKLRHYPDPLQEDLRLAISEMDGVDPSEMVCGNGASEIIMAAVQAFRPGQTLITAPCYAGYREALRACGAEVIEYELREDDGFSLDQGICDHISEDTGMVFIGNPNNPNGRLVDEDLLKDIERTCRESGTVLVIDECFLPLTSLGTSPPVSDDRALHLRAFTKSFSVPALRLGYAVCRDAEILSRISAQLPEWNVSLIAQLAGEAAAKAASGTDFIKESVEYIEEERAFLTEKLSAMDIKVYPSDTNYLLIKSVPDLYDRLLAEGVLIRRCSNFSGLDDTFFRIAVGTFDDNRELIKILRTVL